MEYDDDEDPAEASLAISYVLDGAGYLFPGLKLHIFSFAEFFLDIIAITAGLNLFRYKQKLIGGAGEGLLNFAMFNGTTCDIDIMQILSKCEAYDHSNVDVSQGHWQFQMEPCDRNPGYVKLKVIKEGTVFTLPLSTSITSFFENDSDSNVCYLSNAIPASLNNFAGNVNFTKRYTQSFEMEDTLTEQVVSGPSLSRVTEREFRPGIFAVNKIDQVISIPCPSWPSVAVEWVKRKRNYDWPTNKIILEQVQRGCYVVPVGCKEFERTYLDWRLSFALVEQALIRDLNTTQFKCLLLLKQLKTFLFYGQIGDIISSYILKTTVFWVIEESPPDLWVARRLLKTVQLCLDRLISFVQNDFCPNYFIRSCNLLAKRYTHAEKLTVLQLFNWARHNTRELLCQTPPFNELFCYQYMEEFALHTVDCEVPESAQKMVSYLISVMNNNISMLIRLPLSCQHDLSTTIRYSKRLYRQLKEAFSKNHIPQQETTYVIKQVGLMIKRFVLTDMYLRATNNKCRYRCIRVLRCEFTEMNDLVEVITNCHLNTAVGNYTLSNEVLKVLISKHKCLPYERIQIPVGLMFNASDPLAVFGVILKRVGFLCDKSESHSQSVTDILFLRFEKDLLPPPIQMEMCPNQNHGEHYDISSGMSSTVAVDPLVYACFLRFWCCMKLDQNIEKLKARDDMVWCCGLPDITNKAVAFNLLEFCHKHMEEYDEAFGAVCTAWKQKPRSDATLVHIFVLVHSTIRRELTVLTEEPLFCRFALKTGPFIFYKKIQLICNQLL